MNRSKLLAVALLCFGFMAGSPLLATANSTSTHATQQTSTVTGTVVDATGEAVIGASVVVKGTTNGVITNLDGNFTLSNVPEGATLQISYLGYLPTEVKATTGKALRIELKEDTQVLDEVVVIGYGTVKKSDVTGALTRITDKTIKERPVQNALQALQGKAPGVHITTNTRPGELGNVRIRGNRSINATNDPLYVIDGIPMTAGSVGDINPNDIESMEILKDASATAIYGSRGANGVVLITSKKGKTGKTTINYDGTVTFTDIHSLTDWMDSGELIDWNRQAYINTGAYTGSYGNAPDPNIDGNLLFGGVSNYPYLNQYFQKAWEYNADGSYKMRAATEHEKNVLGYADQVPVYNSRNIPTTPWTDYVTRTGVTHNHQISISAGSENSKLYISMGYLNQESPMFDQYYQRFTANINGEIQATKWLKVGMGMNANTSKQDYGIISNTSNTTYKDSYGYAISKMPYAPAYDENGVPLNVTDGPSKYNPMLDIDQATHETRNYGLMFSSYLEAKILPWLKWRTNLGAQYRNSRLGSYYGNDFSNPIAHSAYAPNTAYNNHSIRTAWTLENLLYADKTFNKIHTVSATLMQSAEYYRTEGLNVRAYNCTFPTALWYSVGNSDTTKAGIGSSFSKQLRASYMARINYSLMDRYLLTVTGRYDGASVLAEGNKWDFFPSTAIAWKMNEEDFMSGIEWINQLKLRVGYGVTGNASIGAYTTSGSMTTSGAAQFFGVGDITAITTGAKASVLPNKDLGWEKTASTNIGVDFGFLNNRINGSIEYYVANTSDLLMSKSLPLMTGYTNITTNIGKTRNKGIEITLSTTNIKTKDFTWKTEFTFSKNKESIVELANGKVDDTSNGWFIGKPIDEVWTYKYDRLWQNTDEDLRSLALYKAISNTTMLPGQAKLVDQDLVEVSAGTPGSATKTITYTDAAGNSRTEEVTYMDNGYGTINSDDNKFLGSFQPKWIGGFTTTFTYKNWELSSFIYARMGNLYYGLLQTYGRRIESNVWSEDNPGGKFPQPRSGGVTHTSYNDYMNYTKGNMVAVRNIALSYSFPEQLLKKMGVGSLQVYGQVLNPFVFGGELVKSGINPDDTTGWTTKTNATNYIGGQTNNTVLQRSYVVGVRVGF
ncbi:SusC/RagA family TonB-linked outer membrane protein [Bacteroides sp. 214]|nr:SusC/RagA family TonB-linked outer membrane protein [Bacteroides sp. 214]